MNHSDDPEVDMVRRLVSEAEEHLARQRAIVERLPSSGEVSAIAHSLLADYAEVLARHRARLAQLERSN